MITNEKLNRAFRIKDDEFYTQLTDIEKELVHYTALFKGKRILCNCDNYTKSNFVRYFAENFNTLGLQSITAVGFTPYSHTTELVEIAEQIDNFPSTVQRRTKSIKKRILPHNGDFRNTESQYLLKTADIVITNPPFSLFREFIDILIAHNKCFLIIGNCNAITYQNCFSYIATDRMHLGIHCIRRFIRPDGSLSEAARSFWYTNLTAFQKNEPVALTADYSKYEYPEYDNYHAIEVNKTKRIPKDFTGVMGVPITFLEKYNPQQFHILGMDFDVHKGQLKHLSKKEWQGKTDRAYLNGKRMYARILIELR